MEIKIPKEVREYHETIFFGLNTRQFVCSLLAVGVAVAVYFLLQPMLDTEEIGWVCILAAAPFAVCGFFTYHGMTPEQLLWAWCKSELLCPKRLVFRSDSYYYAAMQPAIQAGLHQKRKRGKRINFGIKLMKTMQQILPKFFHHSAFGAMKHMKLVTLPVPDSSWSRQFGWPRPARRCL